MGDNRTLHEQAARRPESIRTPKPAYRPMPEANSIDAAFVPPPLLRAVSAVIRDEARYDCSADKAALAVLGVVRQAISDEFVIEQEVRDSAQAYDANDAEFARVTLSAMRRVLALFPEALSEAELALGGVQQP